MATNELGGVGMSKTYEALTLCMHNATNVG